MTTVQISSYSRQAQPVFLAIARVAEQHLSTDGVLTDAAAAILLPDAFAAAPTWYEFDGLVLTYLNAEGVPKKTETWKWPAVAGYSGFTCIRLSTGAEIARFPADDSPTVLVLQLD